MLELKDIYGFYNKSHRDEFIRILKTKADNYEEMIEEVIKMHLSNIKEVHLNYKLYCFV